MNRGFVFIFRLAVHGTRMKKILAAFILGMGCMLAVQAQQHPCVYVAPADRASVLQKVKMSLGLRNPLQLFAPKWKNMWIVIRLIPNG